MTKRTNCHSAPKYGNRLGSKKVSRFDNGGKLSLTPENTQSPSLPPPKIIQHNKSDVYCNKVSEVSTYVLPYLSMVSSDGLPRQKKTVWKQWAKCKVSPPDTAPVDLSKPGKFSRGVRISRGSRCLVLALSYQGSSGTLRFIIRQATPTRMVARHAQWRSV